MKEHDWSQRVTVYEALEGVKCRGCGAAIYALDEDRDLDKDCVKAGLPLDCDQAVPIVIHEEYKDWDEEGWMDEDVPEWGEWGVADYLPSKCKMPVLLRNVPHLDSKVVRMVEGERFPTYMQAFRRCKEINTK